MIDALTRIVKEQLTRIRRIQVTNIRAEQGKPLVIQAANGDKIIEIKPDGNLVLTPQNDKNVDIITSGQGIATYNGVEIGSGTGGGGGGGAYVNQIIGSGCAGSVAQPSVECSPADAPCEVVITVGKGGVLRIKESG